MRDRAKIVVNNREVAKRYLGSRLVWEIASTNPALRLIFQKDDVTISPFWIGYLLIVGNNNIPVNSVTHIQINNKEIFKLKTEKLKKIRDSATLILSENEKGIYEYFETASWYNNGSGKKVVSLKLYTSK